MYISSHIHGHADSRQLLARVWPRPGTHAAHTSKHTRVIVGADVRWEDARLLSNEALKEIWVEENQGLKEDLKRPQNRVTFGWNHSSAIWLFWIQRVIGQTR